MSECGELDDKSLADALKAERDRPKELYAIKPAVPTNVWSAENCARVLVIVERWQKLLFLEHWRIDVEFNDEPCSSDSNTMAEVRTALPYMRSDITIYPLLLTKDPSDQECCLVHELVHIITRPMKGLLWDILSAEKFVTWHEAIYRDETMTDWLTKIIFALSEGRPGL